MESHGSSVSDRGHRARMPATSPTAVQLEVVEGPDPFERAAWAHYTTRYLLSSVVF